ncbi:DUF445 domain-containing protein [Oleomonas cavernae]|uniref:DUF445 domain-containing protein n=2 Tax=Oleomonas cavernae TaxID=2320859 RepID=A0A418WJH0_9PROT|nr:DUF445 domain-containing protein [Oleomonas cavernae]
MRDPLTYALIPVVAAVVGYVTKSLAAQMMFYPLAFVGIRPWLGWQGVVPRKARKMATKAADLLLSKLISPQELLVRLDPERMIAELEQPITRACEDLVREIGRHHLPDAWSVMPDFARKRVIRRATEQVPRITRQLWREISGDFDRFFDTRHLIIENLVRDKALLCNVLLAVSSKEMRFFRWAGFWFGLVLGAIQLGCWMTWHEPWILPAFGALIGLSTDWVALQMLFRPLNPQRFLWFRVQGRFIARQNEVARDYAMIMARQLLTPANMIEELLRGPSADRLTEVLHREVEDAIDAQLGITRSFVALSIGSEKMVAIRAFVVQRIIDLLPETSRHVERYAIDALDIHNTIVERMQRLTPLEFESLLRPVFKEDEITLVLAGAVLGFAIGELQVQFML